MAKPTIDPVIPDACLEADVATIAQKGAGKTYVNRGMVERLLDMGRRVIVLDPLGHWWGLKAKADGSAGYPVAVIGGKHADVPLDPTRGEQLGAFLATANIPTVIDVSELKRGELTRFATAFMAELYRLNEDALWLVLEEADVFAPKQPMNDQTMMLHQVDQISRRGRARGFRLWSITQRPAKLHNDVLSQASTLLLMRLRGPHDRAAAEDWIKGNAESAKAKEIIGSLARLEVGEGYVWAPDIDLLARVKFPRIKTLDTSATPKAGETRAIAKELAKPDIAMLMEIALEPPRTGEEPAAATKVRGKASPAAQGPSPAEIERIRSEAYDAGWDDGLQKGVGLILQDLRPLLVKFDTMRPEEVDSLVVKPSVAIWPTPRAKHSLDSAGLKNVIKDMESDGGAPAARVFIDVPGTMTTGFKPTAPQQRIIDAIAAWQAVKPGPVERLMLAFLADASSKSSGYANNLGALRTAGVIAYPAGGLIDLTADGRALAAPVTRKLSNDAAQRALLEKLDKPKRRIVEALIEDWPEGVSKVRLAERIGVSATSSGYANNLGNLKSLGVIDYPVPGHARAADVLFPFGRG